MQRSLSIHPAGTKATSVSFWTEWNRCKGIIGNTRVNCAVSKENGCCGKGLYCVTLSGFHLTENFILTVLLYRFLYGTCKDFLGVCHLKFAESGASIRSKFVSIKGTRCSWKASHPNPDLTYHYYFWLTASAATLSFLLSSKLNRKFSSPCFQDLTARGLRKLAGPGTKLLINL